MGNPAFPTNHLTGQRVAFAGQELIAGSGIDIKSQLYYWHREARSSNAEVDYLIVNNDRIIPDTIRCIA